MAGRLGQKLETKPTSDGGLLEALGALANPMRLRIVGLLGRRELCVCHLTASLGLTQGTVSYHMGLLKQAGLVEDRRDANDGRWTYYRLNPAGVARLRASLEGLLDITRINADPAGCCVPDADCATGCD